MFRLSFNMMTIAAAFAATCAAAAAQTPAQQTPPKPPLPNRANNLLPSWLRVRGEFRERAEGAENAGFNDARDDLYYLSRLRLNVSTTSKYVVATVQAQDARVARKTVGPTGAPFKAAFDLRQAYADIGTPRAPVVARVGRQELGFGDQRLLGASNWTNAARTFDAARVTIRSTSAQIDLFGASLVRILDGEFDRSGNGNRLAGAYVSTTKLVPRAAVEPYAFYRRDVPTSLRQLTSGVRLAGALPAAVEYNVEMDVQTGTAGTNAIRAWAGHWQARRAFTRRLQPRASGEYNFATGDSSPTDGTRGTFDQLYATSHDKYGLADQVGWRNIHDMRVGIDFMPLHATLVTVNHHSYWLAEKRDGLYAANGALLAGVASGAARARVGEEVDLQVARPLTPQLALAAGYSHLFAGPFLKQATPGRSYSSPFLMLTYVFLAEK
ncbi:MAG: hypothetical protein DMF87_18320, partial [Acidobacteria bacterium]